ncbi:MAG TPA: hypothetical protein GX396_10010 [Tissierellia bacterium]|nr:hypothetical protein [Tissierellia bacterium]
MLIEETIKEFLKYKNNYSGYNKKTVENLMLGDKEYSLIKINGLGELKAEELKESIKLSVKLYTRNKDRAIEIYKKYLNFLNTKKFHVDITFPPIPVSITFERIMFIAKYIQNPENKISDLKDVLWVGPRTIENDLAILKGIKNPIQVNGKRFVIEDIERSRGTVSMSSTAHPIFLTSNITQIIVTLKGLKLMSQNSAFKVYAEEMARSIWTQLSDYAKNRIIYVMENLIPDELEWYKNLNIEKDDSFYNEIRCSSTEGAGCVLDCLKNGKECFVEYQENEKTTFYENCKILKYLDDKIRIECKGKLFDLEIDKILRSSYTLEELV